MAQAQFPIDLGTALASPDTANAQLNYTTTLQSLQARQELAQPLLQDSEKPLSSGVGARGMPYRVNPLEALGRALSGGIGAYQTQENAQDINAAAKTYGQQLRQALRGGAPSAVQPASVQPSAAP